MKKFLLLSVFALFGNFTKANESKVEKNEIITEIVVEYIRCSVSHTIITF